MTQQIEEKRTTETQKQVVVTAICFEGRWIMGYLAATFQTRLVGASNISKWPLSSGASVPGKNFPE
jgi:hypothetical protein